MTPFSIEEVRKIAQLASLELTPEEEARFAEQFTTILEYFEQLKDFPLPDELEHSLEVPPFVRDDVAAPSAVHPEQFSSYLEDGYFQVPRVIDA
jgi:aspartyl-tRNA(Asn)/glutamyl-tRNA(Gln) amidotransferase subunit C